MNALIRLMTITVILISLLVTVGFVLASDITDAQYQGQIQVTNTDEAVEDEYGVFTLDTRNLIEGDMLNTDADDLAVQAASGVDVAFMPGSDGNPWALYIPSIGQNAQQYYYLYTGDVMDGELCYFPGTGGISISDTAALELGDDFEIEQKGLIDLSDGTSKNLVYKASAFKTYVCDSSSVASRIEVTGSDVTYEEYDPSSSVYQQKIGEETWWGQTFIVEDTHEASTIGLKLFRIGTPGTVTVSIRATLGDLPTGDDLTSGTLDGDTFTSSTTGAWYDFTLDAAYYLKGGSTYAIVVRSESESLYWKEDNPGTYEGVRFRSLDGGSSFQNPSSNDQDFAFSIEGSPDIVVKAEDLSTDDYTVKTTADGTDFKIYIDGVEQDSVDLDSASVTDNASDWYFLQNDAMPYLEYQKITVSDVLQQEIRWEYLWYSLMTDDAGSGQKVVDVEDGTLFHEGQVVEISDDSNSETNTIESIYENELTIVDNLTYSYTTAANAKVEGKSFNDLSGNGHDATPTFRTTSSDEDISAELLSFVPIGSSSTPPPGESEYWNLVTEVPEEPENLYNELDMSFLFAEPIQEFSENTDIPLPLIVFPYAFGCALFLGLIAYGVSMGKHGRGSIFVQAIVSLVVMVYFVITGDGVIPAWTLLPFGLEALAGLMHRQSYDHW